MRYFRLQRSAIVTTFVAITAAVWSLGSVAAELSKEQRQNIEALMARVVPGKTVDSITATPMDGLYAAMLGTQVIYVSENGRFIIDGDVIDVQLGINITDTMQKGARKEMLAGLDSSKMIIYPAKEEKIVLTIFTDIDCPYCRKLHNGMEEMNDLGMTVRYIQFPRAGLGSASYKKAVSVWCAKDRNAALTAAKNGVDPQEATCDNPVAEHLGEVKRFSITGTPAILLPDGTLIPGYVPPKRLATLIETGK